MELDRRDAEVLVQELREREERSAIAIASNQPFSGNCQYLWTGGLHSVCWSLMPYSPSQSSRSWRRVRARLPPLSRVPSVASAMAAYAISAILTPPAHRQPAATPQTARS